MLLGLVLAASEFTLTGQFPAAAISKGAMGTDVNWAVMLLPLALPVSIMLLPLADLVLAVVRRTRAGRSPFAPDKQHLHHRMLEIGHSHRRAVFILWLWAGLISIGTVVISLYTGPAMWTALGAATVLTIAATFILPILHRPHLHHAAEPPPDQQSEQPSEQPPEQPSEQPPEQPVEVPGAVLGEAPVGAGPDPV
jgi:UDP-GlcNAc:undecaprenyl-phosphate GlcNAc-1-phosphate transferase